ncbi:hypothetical protein IFO70_33260 [Phormidium tenue FACHB-886]|nr:hypothetical protein [Phormidium tenue FACHB-886]
MLSRDSHNQQQPSPFTLEGLATLDRQQPQQQQPQQPIPERNRGRGLRRAGNASEIAAGTALNSAIVFFFHLMQVHPIFLVVSLSTSYFYFLASAFGEGKDKFVANMMTGASAGIAAGAALSEPVSEWWEAKQSQDAATQQLDRWYAPQQPNALASNGFLILLGVSAVFLLAICSQGRDSNRRRNNRRIY